MDAVTFPSVGIFPTNGTVFLAPTVTNELLKLHHSYHDYFKTFHDNPNSYYVPENGYRIVQLQIDYIQSSFKCNGIYL